jgi:putative FmdB family regulatory protein
MPIYEYRCEKCGEVSELLVMGKQEAPVCIACGSDELVKLMSAHNAPASPRQFLGQESGGCCGAPQSCGNPGSCCAG